MASAAATPSASADDDAGQQPGPLYNVDAAADELVEKLKLLNYERDFCRRKRPYWAPLTRSYFAGPPPPGASYNSNEQFFCFTSLVSWLLHLSGRTGFKAPAQYDDPNASCNAIVIEMKDLGVGAAQAVQGKLRIGHGESVLQILHIAADAAMRRRNVMLLKADCSAADDNDVDDEPAGTNAIDDDDDVENEDFMGAGEFAGGGGGGGAAARAAEADDGDDAYMDGCIVEYTQHDSQRTEEEEEAKAIVEPQVDEQMWRAEVDRVAPRLRVTIAAGATDWRSHVDYLGELGKKLVKMYKHDENQIRVNVVRLSEDIGNVVSELKSREESLNQGLERSLTEYKQQREKINVNQEQYKSVTDNVAELSNELASITARLNEIKAVVDERGSNLSDSSPLVKIKNAIAKLKEELHSMDVRIGVAEHSVLTVNTRQNTILNQNLHANGNTGAGNNGNMSTRRAMSTWRK